MTLLDRTILNGFQRCTEHEVSFTGGAYRQCVRDVDHAGQHEFGPWKPKPREKTQAVVSRPRVN